MQWIDPVSSPIVTLSDGRAIALLELLGRGSYGAVYRGLVNGAWRVQRPVAVKICSLPPEANHEEAMRWLARVGRRAASVRHPSFIQVYEVDRIDGVAGDPPSPFIVTELVEGESLASLLMGWKNDGLRVPIDFAIVVMLRAAEALGAALFTDGADGSLTNLVHGDLSPRQILVSSQGEVKVGDFGQHALADGSSHIRSRSRLACTAPEVACGGPPSARSDVFSLGIILYEMLIGPRFAPGTSVVEAARMVRDGLLHTHVLEPNLPRTLRDIIAKATEKSPMHRYPHAQAMAFDLRREMLRLGLCDTQTCVRHAVVGWCEARGSEPPARTVKNDVAARPTASSGVDWRRSGHEPAA
jgi:serine/threonine-protein kinase